MPASNWYRAGSHENSLGRRLGVVHESQLRTEKSLWKCVFAARKAGVMNKGWMILNKFADYNRQLHVEANANDFLHISSSIFEGT